MITFLMLVGLAAGQLVCLRINNADGVCQECVPGYYLDTTCVKCNIIGCSECSGAAVCTICSQNYTLSNNICFYCDSTYFYNDVSKNCEKCPANCLKCASNTTCLQCQQGFYLDSSSNCSTTVPTLLSSSAVWQSYILDLMPDLRQPIHNSQDLTYACHTNGYVCQCIDRTTNSRCNTYDIAAVKTSLDILKTTVTSSNVTNFTPFCLALEAANINTDSSALITMLGQLLVNQTISNSTTNLALLLETAAKISNNNSVEAIRQFLGSILTNVNVSDGTTLRLQGNGYLFKYSNLQNTKSSDHPAFTTVFKTNQVGKIAQLLIFNRTDSSSQFSGYLFENGTLLTQERTISIPRLASLSETTAGFQLQDVTKGQANRSEVVSSQNGLLTFTISQPASGVFKIGAKPVLDDISYDTSRIQNLFYKPSIFYIIFFLSLYIIFVPLCVFVDFIDKNKASKHKRVTGREVTQQQLRGSSQSESIPSQAQTEIKIPVTYKQFHPIYNIGATPDRPERLAKLSLYLLNLQHTLTFLIIFYAILPKNPSVPNSGVMAIGLVVPAYIINILLNYGFGWIKNKLPGKFKLLINLVAVVYWVIWFFLLQRITEDTHPYYQYYLIIFVVVCAFLDQVFDLLQMMIMYFVLMEDNGQYNCLAKVLSMRGYFEYDKYGA